MLLDMYTERVPIIAFFRTVLCAVVSGGCSLLGYSVRAV